MGQFPKTLAGVIKVQRLGCAAKTIFDQGPQPNGPIDDDEDFLSPSHTATQRLLLHASPELQHIGALLLARLLAPVVGLQKTWRRRCESDDVGVLTAEGETEAARASKRGIGRQQREHIIAACVNEPAVEMLNDGTGAKEREVRERFAELKVIARREWTLRAAESSKLGPLEIHPTPETLLASGIGIVRELGGEPRSLLAADPFPDLVTVEREDREISIAAAFIRVELVIVGVGLMRSDASCAGHRKPLPLVASRFGRQSPDVAQVGEVPKTLDQRHSPHPVSLFEKSGPYAGQLSTTVAPCFATCHRLIASVERVLVILRSG